MNNVSARAEIQTLIDWYDEHGHDWTGVVEFKCAQARGWTPERENQRTQAILRSGYLKTMGYAGEQRRGPGRPRKDRG